MTQFNVHTQCNIRKRSPKSLLFPLLLCSTQTPPTVNNEDYVVYVGSSILSGALNTYNSTLSSYAFALSCVLNFPRYIPTLHMCNAAMDLKTLLFLGQSVVVHIQLQCVIKIL